MHSPNAILTPRRMFILCCSVLFWPSIYGSPKCLKINAHCKFLFSFLKVARTQRRKRWRDRKKKNKNTKANEHNSIEKSVFYWKIDALLNSHVLFALFGNIQCQPCVYVFFLLFFHANLRFIFKKRESPKNDTHWNISARAMKNIFINKAQ